MPGLTRNGRRVRPMTWAGLALLVLLVTVDAAIWFSRSEDDAFAESSRLEGTRKSEPLSTDSAERPPSDEPGTYVTSRVSSDGRLVTDHYVVMAEPVTSVQMRIRRTGYRDFSPAVQQLIVVADDEQVPSAPLADGQSLRRIRLGEPSTVVHLHYVTSGGVVASVPSRTGRALVLANPVNVRTDASTGRHVVEMEGQVRSLSCAPGRQVAQPCGQPDGADGWKVKPNGNNPAVLAQVDLPS